MGLGNLFAAGIACTFLLLVYGSSHVASSKQHRNRHNNTKTQTGPVIKNLTCHDVDLQRTLTWSVYNKTDSLQLKHYNVRYCPVSECSVEKYRLHCYEDGDRMVKIPFVNETYCKTSVLQLLTFSYDTFMVQGIYQDILTNLTVKSKSVYTSRCPPIDNDSALLAPTISTTSVGKDYMKVNMSLPEDLQKTLQNLEENASEDLVVKYYFCVVESGKHWLAQADPCQGESKLENNPRTEFMLLDVDTDYEVIGWYTITGDWLINSTVAKIKVSTLPDPFPQWVQILLICAIAFVLILLILGAFAGKYIHGKFKQANEVINKAIPQFLEDTIRETRRAEGIVENPTHIVLLSDWALLQKQKYDDFYIPPIQRAVQSDSGCPHIAERNLSPEANNAAEENDQESAADGETVEVARDSTHPKYHDASVPVQEDCNNRFRLPGPVSSNFGSASGHFNAIITIRDECSSNTTESEQYQEKESEENCHDERGALLADKRDSSDGMDYLKIQGCSNDGYQQKE